MAKELSRHWKLPLDMLVLHGCCFFPCGITEHAEFSHWIRKSNPNCGAAEWAWDLELRVWILVLPVLGRVGLRASFWLACASVSLYVNGESGDNIHFIELWVHVQPLEQCLAASKFLEIVSCCYCHYNFVWSVLTLCHYGWQWVGFGYLPHLEIVNFCYSFRWLCQKTSERRISSPSETCQGRELCFGDFSLPVKEFKTVLNFLGS